jgi:hypothetical protein
LKSNIELIVPYETYYLLNKYIIYITVSSETKIQMEINKSEHKILKFKINIFNK